MGRRLVSGCECVEKVSGRIVCACLEGRGLCGVGRARLIRDRCIGMCAVGLCDSGPVCGERLLSAGEMKSLCVR